jgi:hypothetical protein
MTTEALSRLFRKAMRPGRDASEKTRVVMEQVQAVLPGQRFVVGGEILTASGRSSLIRAGDWVPVLHEGGKRQLILAHEVLKAQFHPPPEVDVGDFQLVDRSTKIGGGAIIILSSADSINAAIDLADFGVTARESIVFGDVGFCQNDPSIIYVRVVKTTTARPRVCSRCVPHRSA